MKKYFGIIMCLIACIFLTGCIDLEDLEDSSSYGSNLDESSDETESEDEEYTFGSTFEFDDLEITIGDDYSFDTVDNMYSDNDGDYVIVLPVTIKNLSDDTYGLNMFYYNFYGSKGTSLDSVSAYFDEDVDWAGDMRSGATQNTYFHILYDGDGVYYIEFDNYSEEVEVMLSIKK